MNLLEFSEFDEAIKKGFIEFLESLKRIARISVIS